MHHPEQEGVTKFITHHASSPLPASSYIPTTLQHLNGWRALLLQLGLIGQHPSRYGGVGFGNLSARLPPWTAPRTARPFLISGTQTGHLPTLAPTHVALVTRWNTPSNQVWSTGLTPPSSESMTHATLYDLGPHIRCVLHAHSPDIWRARGVLNLPTTRAEVPYGTPEMADEVRRLWNETPLAEKGIFAMAGHLDGVVTFAPSLATAGAILTHSLAAAFTERCS